jgi:hypothetical protein
MCFGGGDCYRRDLPRRADPQHVAVRLGADRFRDIATARQMGVRIKMVTGDALAHRPGKIATKLGTGATILDANRGSWMSSAKPKRAQVRSNEI